MSRPLVTILTPTYHKHRNYLGACIQSVVGQTYDNWELLVCDDGTLEDVVRSFDDERIRYRSRPSHPVWDLYRTYNEMIGESRGDLFAVLEGDDMFPPEKLERQVEIHSRHPEVSVSFGIALRVGDRSEELSTWGLTDRLPRNEPFDARETLLFGCPICAPTAMVPRWAFEQVGGYDQPEGMPFPDYPTWMKLARVGPFYASTEHLGYWRVHDNSSTEHMWAVATGGRELARRYHVDGADKQEIDRYWTDVEAGVLAAIGRDALARRDWAKSRSSFARALTRRLRSLPSAPLASAKALGGFVLATLHVRLPPAGPGRPDTRISG